MTRFLNAKTMILLMSDTAVLNKAHGSDAEDIDDTEGSKSTVAYSQSFLGLVTSTKQLVASLVTTFCLAPTWQRVDIHVLPHVLFV